MRNVLRGLLAGLGLAVLLPTPSALADTLACGDTTETHCMVETGTYRIAMPANVDRPGAMIWLHGWGGSANGVMKNKGWIERLGARGYALIAPDGRITSTRYNNKNWAVNDGRSYERDDIAFLQEVAKHAAETHGIDRDRILLAGFSRGGSMVWDVACKAPEFARAYAPVAGAFWEPMHKTCEGPVDLFHIHGWTDRTVPLEGRVLANGTMIQGDVFQSLFILRATNGCGNRQPESAPLSEDLSVWRRTWSDCTEGQIDLELHPGGHSIPRGWLGRAMDWFEARLAAG